MFVEYREVSVSARLHQGDILEAINPQASMWERHLMVITADCDLAHGKNHGRITCVPVLTAEEYLLEMQIPRIGSRIARKPLTELKAIVSRTGGPSISEARLREWALEETSEDISKALGLDGDNAANASAAVSALRLIDSRKTSLDDAISALVEAQMRSTTPPRPQNALHSVLNELRQAYRQPPGDSLFISAFAPGHVNGYFVYLRHLEQVWQYDVALTPFHRNAKYRRISRLEDRYIFCLVQRFALVFMMIGLPTEYEEMRDFHADSLGDCLQ